MKKIVFFVILFVIFVAQNFGQSPLPVLSGYENLLSKSVALSDTAQEGKSFLFEMNTSVTTGNRYTKWDMSFGRVITFPKGAKISANIMVPDPLGDIQLSITLLKEDVVVMNSALYQVSRGDWRHQNFQFPEIDTTFDKVRLNLSYLQNESGFREIFFDGIYAVIGGVETLLDNCNGDSIPTAPTGLTATSISQTQVDLSWVDNSTNEDYFEIYKLVNNQLVLVARPAANATSYVFTGTCGTAYSFQIVATNAGGNSSESSANATTDQCTPGEATPNVTSMTQTSVTFSWTPGAPTTQSGFSYEVLTPTLYQLVASGSTSNPNQTSATLSGLQCGNNYLVRVYAYVTTNGRTYSTDGIHSSNFPTVACVPTAPSELTSSPLAGTAIEMYWSDNSSDETGFKLFRNGVQIRTLAENAKYYVDIELTCGTSYSYYVVAYNEGGNSVPSNTVAPSTLPCNDSVFVFTSPINGGEYKDSVVVSWAGGEAELQFMDMSGTTIQNPSQISSPYVFRGMASGEYQLRGRFTNPQRDWSPTVIFKVKSSAIIIADAPGLVYPLNDATGLPVDPLLQWNAVSVPGVKYELVLGTSSNLLNPLYEIKVNLLQFRVAGLSYSTTYYWKARAVFGTSVGPWSSVSNFMTIGVTDVSDNSIPTEFKLAQNYPNPFNPTTTITYQLPQSGNVVLKVFDILGNEIKTLVNEQKEIGSYTVEFDASSLASGLYIYQLRVNDYSSIKKMILMK
ncbi:MAG: fibronectin type III domain-containing protein [Candidatus Paceibacterota bacterium]|jgi:hypothetical protein